MTVYIALYRTLQREPTRTSAGCLQHSALALRSAQRILRTLQRASEPRAHVVASQSVGMAVAAVFGAIDNPSQREAVQFAMEEADHLDLVAGRLEVATS